MRYNWTMIDLYDRSAIAILNGKHITADLAIKTIKIALNRHKPDKGFILHSDQASQFSSKQFKYFNLFAFNLHENGQGIYEFIYVKYNHVRPRSYNKGLTPYEARCAA